MKIKRIQYSSRRKEWWDIMAKKHFIEVKNLVKNYGMGNIKVTAVDNVSFYVDKGAFIGIMGASGSGKTTILNILSTIDKMSGGQVLYDMADISQMTEEELSDFRQENLGFVFQDYNLLDTLSIEENIMLPMALCGRKKEEIESRVKSISETLHICDFLLRQTSCFFLLPLLVSFQDFFLVPSEYFELNYSCMRDQVEEKGNPFIIPPLQYIFDMDFNLRICRYTI